MVWCWDNLNLHLVKEWADFAKEHKDWLRIFQMPSYAPELNPAEGSGRSSSGTWPTSPPPISHT
ncbi:transposase [Streptomyces xiangluensis]|uniref:Transposase n=1 Tax=Streptomyces xiangluensis TaxID=2665720 RepID=A0ABV8YII2_9ACTN